jgi:ATP-dependent Clp protease ATP-binding subunit ClpC
LNIHATAALSKILSEAHRIAQAKRHGAVNAIHALQALISSDAGNIHILSIGVDITRLIALIDQDYLHTFPTKTPISKILIDPAYKVILQRLDNQSICDRSVALEPSDLLAALRAPDITTGRYIAQAGGALPEYISLDAFFTTSLHRRAVLPQPKRALVEKMAVGEVITAIDEDDTPDPKLLLEKYSTDMTAAARNGCFDPAVARDREIEYVIDVLQRRTKNNPLLVGEAGVGKTALIEGLAQRIILGQVPIDMQRVRLLSLDLVGMLSGARYRGDFEERLHGALRAVVAAGDIILFVDELHTIMGSGSSDGSMSAGNILKPLLARGLLRMIGATTFQESKLIEKDAAMARRFQAIVVKEPTAEQAIQMLEAVVPKYEAHHGVRIDSEAVAAAVHLSKRYIVERKLPDKALDVLDHAAARLHTGRPADYLRLIDLRNKLANTTPADVCQYEQLRLDITNLENSLPLVDIASIEQVVSQRTGVPVESLSLAERTKLKNLEVRLGERISGQALAVSAVANAIRRNRTGLSDTSKPWGSFLFLGPTGVGKTVLSTALAEILFNTSESLIRINMGEYSEKNSVSRLIGSPPGYIGHDTDGTLTEALRRRPYSVLLFDEVEKASSEVWSLLFQLLDNGYVTDGQGRPVDACNTVIIMTSNVGAQELFAATTEAMGEECALQVASKILPADLYSSIDDVLLFKFLSANAAEKILDRFLINLSKKLALQRVSMVVSEGARAILLAIGFDRQDGARPLKRALQKHVENAMANCLLDVHPGSEYTIEVYVDDTSIKVTMHLSPTLKLFGQE